MRAITRDEAEAILRGMFAPWVLDLGLTVEATGPGTAILRMRLQDRVARVGGIVSGQAIAALGDTAMVIALSSALGGFRPVATVNLNTAFLKAIRGEDALAEARVLRLGRTLAFAEVAVRGAGGVELAATVSGSFAVPAEQPAGGLG
ncbi:MAG TPA: PaaI family thioesterase [Acetobacteraceae bacterium]|nr:PaaI family thioesterase [Acetobacteraceae bacterium]